MQIFGFEDIRQYDQLVQLLIMVRAPKLSKDFRPTEVKKLLNLSLQVLTDDDLSAKRAQLKQARESCAQLTAQLEQGENRLQKLEDGLSRREVNLRKLTRECDDTRAAVRQLLRELDDQNELLCLGQEHNQYVHSLKAERLVADSQALFAALRQRSRQIGEVLRALQKAEEARTVYDSACQTSDQAAAAVREAQIVLRDTQTQEREDRDLLEAQLTDTGLLDALVVPEEHLPAIRELLEEYPDRFLIPGPAVEQPVQGLIPDAKGRFSKEIAACLRGISQTDLSAEAALLPDGRFRCGMIQGRSHPEAPAGFVGAAAREANRQRQIRELEERLEQLYRFIAPRGIWAPFTEKAH